MNDELEYTEREAEREEAAYRTPAATHRRRLVRDALDPDPGATVLSIGCGPGFEPAELSDRVGAVGRVCGIDRSPAMLARAARRCGDDSNVALLAGDAVSLPLAPESVDAGVAVQVYEYVDALEPALDALRRVLEPGGMAVVYDTDFDSLVWRSTDPERSRRILAAFDDHCPRPRLGSRLAPHLREAGFMIEDVRPNSILNTRLSEDTFAYHLMEAVSEYVVETGKIEPDVAASWVDDLRSLDDAGETFFNLTQYLYLVRKPA